VGAVTTGGATVTAFGCDEKAAPKSEQPASRLAPSAAQVRRTKLSGRDMLTNYDIPVWAALVDNCLQYHRVIGQLVDAD
jgi:hypothetical protein